MPHVLLSLLAVVVMAFLTAFPARAELKIDVTRGVVEPMPVAVTDFSAERPEHQQLARDIPQVVSADLQSSGLFKLINPQSFLQDPASINATGPRFPEWKTVGAQGLVSGKVVSTGDGRARVEFRLWDVFGQQQLTGMAYTTTQQNWRRIAHIIADEIFKRMTGESGYFDTRVVYISESGPATKRVKRLAIMDQDGFNHRYLTDGSYLVLTPRFSPSTQTITYMSYNRGKPRVYLYDLNSGRQEVLGDFPGMTFAPRFSPDGSKVVMSMAQNGNSDIYAMDLSSRRPTRLTDSPGIDTAPSFAPDGRQIAFESDRGGSQQIYVMNSDGSGARRITFGQGKYGNPVWSPRGDIIAFTKIQGGRFYVGVIRPDGSGERLITSAFHVEGPSWAPNGRYLTYFKEATTGARGEGRSAKLYSIDLTGYNERQLPTPQDGSDPAWSPINP